MADEGPTTVGSIDAKLKIDKSEWDRDAAAVKAEAAELGALDPTVKVDANVGAALAKLAAVAKAERDLDVAYQRSAISQDKLAAVTKKWGDDSTQAAQARLTLTRALNAEQDAEGRLATAKGRDTAETDKNTDSVNKNHSANQRRVTGLQTLIALSPAILAAAAPIASAAVGLGAAFGVMAGAGVLAVVGIKQAMEQGTAVGNAYANGLGGLKVNLDQLAQTAAVRMLGSFQSVVGDINARMPFLNQLIGDASGALGQMGGTALSGVLNGLTVMNPLINYGTMELQKFVGWLSAMPSSNGFSDFVQYAIRNLPTVMTFIEGLVTLGGNILAAFAPLGPVMLGFLNMLVSIANALPGPALAGVVTTVVALGTALRIAGSPLVASGIASVGEALVAVGISADLAVPVVGILLAALTGLAVGAMAAASSQQTATAAVQDYTQALKDDNDQIGANVRAVAAKALVDDGAAAAAQRQGIAMSTLLNAYLGVPSAIDSITHSAIKFTGVLDVNGGQAKQAAADHQLLMNTLGQGGAQIDQTRLKTQQMNAMLGDTSGATSQSSAIAGLAARYGMTTVQYQAALTTQTQTKDQMDATTRAMQVQGDAAGLLKQAWDRFNGASISAAEAQNTFDSSLVNMGNHMTSTGKHVRLTSTELMGQSAASIQLRQQMVGQVQAMEGVIEANGGMQHATAASRAEYAQMRQKIIDNAVAHGIARDAAEKYINTLYKTPPKVSTTAEMNIAAAMADAHALQAYINGMHGASIVNHIDSIYSDTHTSNGRGGSGGQTAGGYTGGNVGSLAGLAGGGKVPGSAPMNSIGDNVLAMVNGKPFGLRSEEWVINGEQSKKNDHWLKAINDGLNLDDVFGPASMVRRSSAQSIGQPALNYVNSTGKLPASGGQPVNVQVFIDGKEMRGDMVRIAVNAVNAGFQQANNDAGRRPSR